MQRLTVIIANYNYARFLPRSVESALSVDWADVEVIVVDDGSTDDSLAVLEQYRDRVRVIESENRGQREAVNLGFSHATGDAVLFLDSDDVLAAGVAAAAAPLLIGDVAKVQFRMQRIDEQDAPIGSPFPDYRTVPSAPRIRSWVLRTTAYPTPPGSGNLYARWFLDLVMPQGPEIGDFADSGLLACAPLLGDVVIVPQVLVGYRRHDGNDSSLRRKDEHFHRESMRAYDRWNHALAISGRAPDPSRVFRSREVLQFRAAAARLTPTLRIPQDSSARIIADALRSPWMVGPEGPAKAHRDRRMGPRSRSRTTASGGATADRPVRTPRMSLLTVTTLLAVVLSIFSRRGISGALGIGAATPAGACLILGPIVIPTFYGVGIAALAVVIANTLLRPRDAARRGWIPGIPLLLALLAYTAFVTVVAPFLFNGLQTVTPSNVRLVPGILTSSNIAQLAYLSIGIGVVAFIARARIADPGIIGIAAGVSVYLSAWRYTYVYFNVPFPEGVFDNSPSFVFIQTAVGGADRFRGIFSEPSALAASCLVTIVYFLAALRNASVSRRVFGLVTAGVAAFLGIVSTSTTFLIAGLVFLGVVAAVAILSFLARRSAVSAMLAVVGCVSIVVAVYAVPILVGFVQAAVSSKLTGDSYENRSSADADSFHVFLETWGIGVGVGAGRGSSLLPTLLSTVGIVGTMLLAASIVLLLRRAAGADAPRPVVWTLVVLLIAKLVAGADLADPSGLIWICLGLLANRAVTVERWPNLSVRSSFSGTVARETYL